MVKDSCNCFERVYRGMDALSGSGSLGARLEGVLDVIGPLRVADFPEPMRNDFIAIKEGIVAARSTSTSDEDRRRIAKDFLALYTKAARLDGTLQEVVGGLSTV